MRHISVFCVLSFVTVGCAGGSTFPEHSPSWSSPPLCVDLRPHSRFAPDIAFADDGKAICAIWTRGFNSDGDASRLVFEIGGRIRPDAVEASGKFSDEIEKRFLLGLPHSLGWGEWKCNTSIRRFAPCPEFVENSAGWVFEKDATAGFRIITTPQTPPPKRDGRVAYPPLVGEYWQLMPNKRQCWTFGFGNERDSLELAALTHFNKEPVVLVKLCENIVYVLSCRDGRLIERCSLPDSESLASTCSAIDSNRGLFAVGTYSSRLVRVWAFRDSWRVVASINPSIADGGTPAGTWVVDRVLFCGGKYLLIDYRCDHGGVGLHDVTEIWDVESWRKVWWKNSKHISSVALSPDGKKMAFVRAGWFSGPTLEIGDFSPRPSESVARDEPSSVAKPKADPAPATDDQIIREMLERNSKKAVP